MRFKYLKVTEEDIWWWIFNNSWNMPTFMKNPQEVIDDIKNGKTWTYKGIPIRLKPLKGSDFPTQDKKL